MSQKPWSERPLWEKVWLGPTSKIYLHAGKFIGHLGCSGFQFYDMAKLLPIYDKLKFENAVRDLTVYAKREQDGWYELHATARKVLRCIIGPTPDDPDYVRWWTARLVSVRQMKEACQTVEWAESPPVPLPAEKPPEEEKSAKKPVRKPR